MKNFIDKLERKFGRYAIHNLTMYLIVGYVAGYVLQLTGNNIINLFTFNPYLILHGQIWRLITWLIIPPSAFSIFTIIMLLFYYQIGQTLETTWGAFRYNLFIITGILFTILGAFIAYFLMAYGGIGILSGAKGMEGINIIVGQYVGSSVTTYYIMTTLLLAFAATYPDMEILFYMIIPLKMKWFALFDFAMIIFDFIRINSFAYRIVIIASILNFIIFFFSTRNYYKYSKTRRTQKKNMKEAKRIVPQYENGARHKCHICGRTELDDPNLEFRYCSKCNGNYEYCQDHLFTHEHVK